MIETKTCECKTVFSRPPGQAQGTWDQIRRCESCRNRSYRDRQTQSGQPSTQLGRYDFPKCLDVFLYQTKPTLVEDWSH